MSHNGSDGKSISVQKASEILGKSEQFIRVGLQKGILPFGSAVKISTRWTYYISPGKLFEYAGIKTKREVSA